MNEELIKDKIKTHEKRINNHSERLDKIEQSQSEFKIEIKNLCEQIKNLVSIGRWFMGMLIGSFIAFFFYVIQHTIFK